MKILVTGTRGIPNILGGVETHCEELFPRIVEKGYDVTLVRRSSYVNDNFTEYKGVKLIDIGAPKKKSFEALIHTWKAIWKARKLKVDIIHIHSIGPALLTPVAKIIGLKVVFTHHGPDYDRDKWGKLAKLILKFGERMGCMFANEVIVISEVIKNLIKEKYNRTSGVHLIYNGVSEPNFIESTDYLEELGINSRKYVLAIGRFVPEKNFHQLIKAYSDLKLNDYKLVLVGDTDFEDNYSHMLKKMAFQNNVVLTGFIKGEKLYTVLSHASLFILPSSHEGLPIVLLEAMSYHLPVLVSNIPANLEVGLSSKCYFKVGDVEELKNEMKEFFFEDWHTVNYNMDKYRWSTITNQLIDVYNKLI